EQREVRHKVLAHVLSELAHLPSLRLIWLDAPTKEGGASCSRRMKTGSDGTVTVRGYDDLHESVHTRARPQRTAPAAKRFSRLRTDPATWHELARARPQDLGAVRGDRSLPGQVRGRDPQVQVPVRTLHLVRRLRLVRRALVRRRVDRADLHPRDGPLARGEAGRAAR